MNWLDCAQAPMVFGHRGLNTVHLENSIEAIEHAAHCGAAGVEIDVRPCQSGELVVFHDVTLERLAVGGDTRRICDLGLAEIEAVELRGGYRIPTLEQVLTCSARLNLKLNVELKHDVPQRGLLAQRSARILHPLASNNLLVSSFDPLLLLAFQQLCPKHATGILLDGSGAGARFAKLAAHFPAEAICAHHSLIDAKRIARWRRAGKAIVTWTVNDRAEQQRLERLGVEAIICDDPCQLAAQLRS